MELTGTYLEIVYIDKKKDGKDGIENQELIDGIKELEQLKQKIYARYGYPRFRLITSPHSAEKYELCITKDKEGFKWNCNLMGHAIISIAYTSVSACLGAGIMSADQNLNIRGIEVI